MSAQKLTAAEVPHGKIKTALERISAAWADDAGEIVKKINGQDQTLLARLTALAKAGGQFPLTSLRQADVKMETRAGYFFEPRKMADTLLRRTVHSFSLAELKALEAGIPWVAEELNYVPTYPILFPGKPLSIVELLDNLPTEISGTKKEIEALRLLYFACKEKVQLRWYVLSPLVDITMRKEWRIGYEEQLELLKPYEEPARAGEVIMALLLCRLVEGKWPYFGAVQRILCRDTHPSLGHVEIYIEEDGPIRFGYCPLHGATVARIAVSRKLPWQAIS